MGGGFFDSVWDPYNGVYAYPKAQPRAPYYARAPVRTPEVRSPGKVEEALRKKTVRTIPVTDGGAAVAVPQQVAQAVESEGTVDVMLVATKLEREDEAATKIQAVYRGYLVRKTQPLKQLRVVKKVKDELEGFKRRLQESEQKEKLRSNAQERLRWTEGVMTLLLRLDTLQGVHPEVRLVRKALTTELIRFQETIDSMSGAGSGGLNEKDEASIEETDVLMEGANVNDAAIDVATAEENFDGQGVKATEDSTSDKHVPQVQSDLHNQVVDLYGTNFHDESGPLMESKVGHVSEPVSTEADPEVPMDVENEQILTTEEVEVEPASSPIELPPTDAESDNHKVLGEEDSAAAEPSRDVSSESVDASVAPAKDNNVEEMWDQAHHMERGEDSDRLTEEAGRPVLQDGVNGVLEASTARLEEKETTSGFTDQRDGRMIPAGCTRSTSLEPQYINKFQVCQPSTADDANALSNRALLLQLLEENRKLKDVVGKVLQWGKHQSDVIHNLAARIEQLEEHHPPQPKLLHDEESKGRKTKGNNVSSVSDRGGSLQRSEKGRRKGKSGNRPQHSNYIDSEDWPSAEYF